MSVATAAGLLDRAGHAHANGRVAGVVYALSAMACLSPWIGPPTALVLGATLALTVRNPFQICGRRLAKPLLQGSIVLLGFGMNLPVVLRAGASGILFAAATIALALLLGTMIGRLLRIRRGASLLIGCGTAICGGSAIAAVGSATDADEADMSVAMGVVFLLNALALVLFPPLGHALGLPAEQFGTWAGVAIHDVSSVVGAAGQYGGDALQVATAVKLSRALWIVPLTLVVAGIQRRRLRLVDSTVGFDAAAQKAPNTLHVPWFIGLFLLASVCRSTMPAIAAAAPYLEIVAKTGLTLALFFIGTGLSAATLRSVGWKALAQGVVLWVTISGVSLAWIRLG